MGSKKYILIILWILQFTSISAVVYSQNKAGFDERIIIIRHGEKPEKGDNLSCAGLNRALALPNILVKKFGVPDHTYVSLADMGKSTSSVRMLQTVTPLAVKYNLTINSQYDSKDVAALAADLLHKKGTVLLVWEHNAIEKLVKQLGVTDSGLTWPDTDYDSIWIVTIRNGAATLTKDKENIHPAAMCR